MTLQNQGVVSSTVDGLLFQRYSSNNTFFLFQGAEGLLAAASTLGRPLEEFGNDERVEALWAIKAMEHAEVYFNVSFSQKQVEDFLDVMFAISCFRFFAPSNGALQALPIPMRTPTSPMRPRPTSTAT